MTIKSILVATDLSAHENVAVQRAWQLADAHRATVKLMYLPARGRQPAANAAHRLANTARQMEESLELRVKTVPVKAHRLENLLALAKGVDLVVLPHRRERFPAAFMRGQPFAQVLRSCECPVLVTTARMRGAHYQRILVAVDFSERSKALVKFAATLDTRAQLDILHAISTLEEAKLRSAEATEQAVRAYRERRMKDAQQRMLALTASIDALADRFTPVIGRGDPARQAVIQQQASGADLVVVGKARSSAWQDLLCGSVAHRVLRWGSSDVLVVPRPRPQRTASIAARRILRTEAGHEHA